MHNGFLQLSLFYCSRMTIDSYLKIFSGTSEGIFVFSCNEWLYSAWELRFPCQPFCDGTHLWSRFRLKIKQHPVFFKAPKDMTASLCLCKQTNKPPYCDGAHRRKEVQEAVIEESKWEGTSPGREQGGNSQQMTLMIDSLIDRNCSTVATKTYGVVSCW